MTSLSYHSSHGSNVKLLTLQTAEHKYMRAQGTFMLATPLTVTSPFRLAFEGQGIVKLHALPTKVDAINHLKTKKPLPKGSVRLRTSRSFVWNVSFDPQQNMVLLVNEDFDLKVRGGGMLIFDIEYGDVLVSAVSINSRQVRFDSFNHSPCIQTVNDTRSSSAQLKHFNPLGLCRLKSPVRKGHTLRLRITGNKGKPGLGPYIRLHMTSAKDLHQNVPTFRRLGPELVYSSELFYVQAGQEQLLTLTFHEEERPQFKRLETDPDGAVKVLLGWPWSEDCLLWFELNKVSIRTRLWDNPSEAAHHTALKDTQVAADGYEVPSSPCCASPCSLGSNETHTLTESSSQEQTERKTTAPQSVGLLDNWQHLTPTSCLNNIAVETSWPNYTDEETLLKRVVSVSIKAVQTDQRYITGTPLCTQQTRENGPTASTMDETSELQMYTSFSSFSTLTEWDNQLDPLPGRPVQAQVTTECNSGCTVAPVEVCQPNVLSTEPDSSVSSGSFFLSDGDLQCLQCNGATRNLTLPVNRNSSSLKPSRSHDIQELKY